MTIKTWKEEFYPKAPTKGMSKKAAIEHSLKKWRGLTRRNLKKHWIYPEFSFSWDCLKDDDEFQFHINSSTCALCKKYIGEFGEECTECPLFQLLGNRCDGGMAPYNTWINKGDPKPMIKALEETLKGLEK